MGHILHKDGLWSDLRHHISPFWAFCWSNMLQNGSQMVLRMHVKSIKIRTWAIFCVKIVLEVIRDTFRDHFEIRFKAYFVHFI